MNERRNFERIVERCLIKVGNEEGFLIDFSEDGMGISVRNIPSERELTIRLKFEGTEFILKGEIIWEGWNKCYSNLSDIGVQLIDPPEEYINFVKSALAGS